MKIVEGTSKNFEKEVLKCNMPVIVDFGATWCPPCQALHPILDELAEERDDLKIVTVDIDDEKELAMKWDVSSIPCVIAFVDGKEIERRIGLLPKKRIVKMVNL